MRSTVAVGREMFGLGQAMVDVGLGASELEGMGSEDFSPLEAEPDLRSGGTAMDLQPRWHPARSQLWDDLRNKSKTAGWREVRSRVILWSSALIWSGGFLVAYPLELILNRMDH